MDDQTEATPPSQDEEQPGTDQNAAAVPEGETPPGSVPPVDATPDGVASGLTEEQQDAVVDEQVAETTVVDEPYDAGKAADEEE